MSGRDDWICVGRIVGVQGLKGELRVNPASDFPERFTTPGTRWLRGKEGETPDEVHLNKGRQLPGKTLYVVRLEGIDNRNAAEALVGQELLVSVNDRPELKEGEFHLLDLVGLEARLTADGPSFGTVSDLMSGGNDLLEVTTTEGNKLLIPFVESIVPEVHLEYGWILITPPPGLLELR